MSDPFQAYEPPYSPRAASSIAALVFLLFVFVAGVAVGQSGVLDPGEVGGLPASPPASDPVASPGGSVAPATPEDFDLFWDALRIIRENYVGREELNDRDLTYGAIRGLVEALGDTGHSRFLTPDEVRSEQNALEGTVVGVGVLLGERGSDVVVISVLSSGPARRAGMRSGDMIVAVDGESVVGFTPERVAALVRGEEGSTVQLLVERPSAGELEFSIVRERIRVPAVSWTMVPGTDVAMLRLVQFSAGSADELRAARDEAIAGGAEALIFDLRGNPGGFVDQAVDVASLFVADETVYIREMQTGERIPVPTNPEIEATDLPMVVLLDAGTASSAEIVAGAIKSAGRAPLVGETTFGTGTVLLSFDLPDGSAIRLAVERWLTPEGELIFGRGIAPTFELLLGPDDVPVEPDELRDIPSNGVPSLSDSQLLRALEILAPADFPPAPSP